VLESLSGLPFDVEFLSFDDIEKTVPDNIDIIINAGAAGDAWSGGTCWGNTKVVENLTKWVYKGGAFIGIGEPSALEGGHRLLRMAHVLGVDIDNGDYTRHGRWTFDVEECPGLIPEGIKLPENHKVMLTDGTARVLAEQNGTATLTANEFGKGTGLFCTGFVHTPSSPRLLQNLILFATKEKQQPEYVTDDPLVEAAFYPKSGKLALINNSQLLRQASCVVHGKKCTVELKPFELTVIDI
jgi:beta-D-galactosyl-(1->4)-L-rhamnose phosphorylase